MIVVVFFRNYFYNTIFRRLFSLALLVLLLLLQSTADAQNAYFADGFHGGIYGHYPDGQTKFIVEMLNKYPDWKINLEIEPATWDSVAKKEPEVYEAFKKIFSNQTNEGRIEYVNPTYAQSYLWNISGESIIRQFRYGMEKLKEHFPDIVFTTYSSEEPCFTSCLPQLLTSFGFKYAVLKNPDTDWGGYVAGTGGELINWFGSDSSQITTVPRYSCEALMPHSTWQTIAWNNSTQYIQTCFDNGIRHPVGMCYQDAMWSKGWNGGPWLGGAIKNYYKPSKYIIWRDYIQNIADNHSLIYHIQKIADNRLLTNYLLSQEDIRVSLVWGAQVLQKIAQEVRSAENDIVRAEKIAAMAKMYRNAFWSQTTFDIAWKNLLLSQHHDCWITPYNRSWNSDKTWWEQVAGWTNFTKRKSDSITNISIQALAQGSSEKSDAAYLRVFNGLGYGRNELVTVKLPDSLHNKDFVVTDAAHHKLITQTTNDELMFKAAVPAFGYGTFELKEDNSQQQSGAHISKLKDGIYRLETDFYKIIIDPVRGGIIKHLIAKKLNNKDFVDTADNFAFNEIRGNFYKNGGFRSNKENGAEIKILENGPLRIALQIKNTIAGQPYTQTIALQQGRAVIDFDLKFNWEGNPGIGAYSNRDDLSARKKDFYNDSSKLLVLFPLMLKGQQVYKDAPFDICKSKLTDTFFDRWDSIKNNIILHWIDVTGYSGKYGMALFTDHTTSYVHGAHYPLGLNLQYSGYGLWGRDYTIAEPSEIRYAIVPHEGNYESGNVAEINDEWNEPLLTAFMNAKPKQNDNSRSLIQLEQKGIKISTVNYHGNNLRVRLYNESGTAGIKRIFFDCKIEKATLILLNDSITKNLDIHTIGKNKTIVDLYLPKFGIATLQLENVRSL
ncbi:MAG: glycosyl hydrolase [Chitinophagaceae bacterium]|jgi:alpha-mannosidase|nr:glycosyl hydrolase [Chitinophagaceae bacterium]